MDNGHAPAPPPLAALLHKHHPIGGGMSCTCLDWSASAGDGHDEHLAAVIAGTFVVSGKAAADERWLLCNHPAWPDPLELWTWERAREAWEKNPHPEAVLKHRATSTAVVFPAREPGKVCVCSAPELHLSVTRRLGCRLCGGARPAGR